VVGNPDLERYSLAVRTALTTILGESGAKAILFYIGDVSPGTFEAKLHMILGEGAPIIIAEVKRRTETDTDPSKEHWVGGNG
jgi:hypothetical protein